MAELPRAERLLAALGDLRVQCPEIEAASIVTYDGLPMAAALPPGMDEDRVAAMCAALLSLGERASEGLGRGDLMQVAIEGENGRVHLVSADDEAVLVAVSSKAAKSGLILFELKRTALLVAKILAPVEVEEPPGTPVNLAPTTALVSPAPVSPAPVSPAPVSPAPVGPSAMAAVSPQQTAPAPTLTGAGGLRMTAPSNLLDPVTTPAPELSRSPLRWAHSDLDALPLQATTAPGWS